MTRVAPARRLLLGAVLAGLALRAAFGLFYWQGKPLTHDEREYLALAANVAAGRGFSHELPGETREANPAAPSGAGSGVTRDGPPGATHAAGVPKPDSAVPGVQRFGRAPIYPLFLAPIVAFDPALREGRMPADVPAGVQIAQAIVGALGVWLIGVIARRISGERAGTIAAWIAAIYPPLVWICAYALSEAIYTTLVLACVYWLMPALDGERSRSFSKGAHVSDASDISIPPSPPWGERGAAGVRGGSSAARLFTGGLFIGLAILTRPATLFFLPLAMLLAWRRRPALAGWMLAGALLVVLPWTARNAVVYGRFVLVASEGGVTFWTGNHPAARGEGDLAANPHLKLLNLELRARHPGLTEEELEPIYYAEALRFIRESPLQWVGLVLKKLFYTWVPIGPSYRLHSTRYFWASVLSYGAVLPFGVLGAWRLWRAGRRPWTLWALAASACLVALIFFPQERFRIPVIDPTLIVCAAAALAASIPTSAAFRDS